MDLIDNIYEIFPDGLAQRNRSRSARGAFDFIGHLAHQLFGIASDEELRGVSQQVSHALSAGSSGVAQLEHQIYKLASASKLTNDNIEITNQRLKEVREQLLNWHKRFL